MMAGIGSLIGVCIGFAIARTISNARDAKLFYALRLPGPVNLAPPTTAELGDIPHAGET